MVKRWISCRFLWKPYDDTWNSH